MTRDVGFDAFSEAAITRAGLLKRLLVSAAAVSVAARLASRMPEHKPARTPKRRQRSLSAYRAPSEASIIARGFDIQSAVAYSLFLRDPGYASMRICTWFLHLRIVAAEERDNVHYEVRPGVKFSDGSTLTAEDVAFSLSRHADPKVGSEIASYMSSFKSATASGPLEVTVKLKRATSFWPLHADLHLHGPQERHPCAGFEVRAPRAAADRSGHRAVDCPTFAADKGVTLTRNEQYWGPKPASRRSRSRSLKMQMRVSWRYGLDQLMADSKYLRRRPRNRRRVHGVRLYTAPGQRVYLYCFDFETKPFQDIHVRRAFAHAFDQKTVVKGLIHGYGQPASSIVPPTQWQGLPGMTESRIKAIYRSLQTYPFDLDKAKHELSQSTVPKGFKTHIEYPENQPEVGQATQAFAENLSKIGVTLSIKQLPFQKWSADTLSHKNLGLTNTTFYPDYPDPADYLNTHMSKNAVKNGVNYANYKNPKVDRLMNLQQRSSNPAVRAKLIAEVLRISAHDLPYLPMWWENVILGLDDKFAYSGRKDSRSITTTGATTSDRRRRPSQRANKRLRELLCQLRQHFIASRRGRRLKRRWRRSLRPYRWGTRSWGQTSLERALASQMGISRPTLREATKLLANAGVVRVEAGPGGGTFITSDLVPTTLLQDQMNLRVDQLSDVLEARRILEPRIAEAAAVRADQSDFDALARIISKQRQFEGDREHLMELDRRFHLGIAQATRNRMLVAQMKLLFRQLEIVRDMAVRGENESEWSIEIHERTRRAIMSRDLRLVDEVMDEHLDYLERLWERESGRGLMTGLPDFLVRPEHRTVTDAGRRLADRNASSAHAGERVIAPADGRARL